MSENRPLKETTSIGADYLVLAVALGAAVVAWGVASALDRKGDKAREEVARLQAQGVLPEDAVRKHLKVIADAEDVRQQAEIIAGDEENWHRP